MFTYLDFLKQKIKVQIDGDDYSPTTIDSASGLSEIHPNVEHFVIGNTNISDVSDFNQMRKLNVLMLYSNPKIVSVNGLEGLNLYNFTLYRLDALSNLNVQLTAKKVLFDNCPNFKPTLNGITEVEELDITNCLLIKDLTFLKKNSETLRKVYIKDTKINSLFGIQYCPNTKFEFRGETGADHFLYHEIFYSSLKGKVIKDYWKELVDYWLDSLEKNKTTILGVSAEDVKEIFIDGINLPQEEIERLFTDDEKRYIQSVTGISKFKL